MTQAWVPRMPRYLSYRYTVVRIFSRDTRPETPGQLVTRTGIGERAAHHDMEYSLHPTRATSSQLQLLDLPSSHAPVRKLPAPFGMVPCLLTRPSSRVTHPVVRSFTFTLTFTLSLAWSRSGTRVTGAVSG